MKTHVCISLDSEIHNQFKALSLNLSKEVEDYLRVFLAKKEGNPTKIDLELEKKREKQVKTQLNLLKIEFSNIQKRIRLYESNLEEQKIRELKKEKERLDKIIKCNNCGKLLDEKQKTHVFGSTKVCNECFMLSDGKQISKWMSKKTKKDQGGIRKNGIRS